MGRDWILLRQALVNIVHNAIKFTPVNGQIEIRVLTCHGQQAVIEVQDSGPGVPETELTKLFDRFYRLDPARSRDSGGAGLGLAIARWTIEIHDGKITAQNVRNSGCLFRIELPCIPQRTRTGLEGTRQRSELSSVMSPGDQA